MNCYNVCGYICLKDDFGIEYIVSSIEYTKWENEDFEYKFKPLYSVIDLLDYSVFQGIPGIDLSLRKQEYVRRNSVPTFISERSPSFNRQDLWEWLDKYDMKYLNQLEWLIKTDTKYIGDRLYVIGQNHENSRNEVDALQSAKRSYDIQKQLLNKICSGENFVYDGFEINDSNRKICYDLIYRLFQHEAKRIRNSQKDGIDKAKRENKYHGRKSIDIDDTKIYEVWRKYKNKKMTLDEVTKTLNISESTFYRRVRNFK